MLGLYNQTINRYPNCPFLKSNLDPLTNLIINIPNYLIFTLYYLTFNNHLYEK